MKIKLLCILIFCQILMYSQTKNGFINTQPEIVQITAPTMASFNKYINNPVGLYNGRPDVNIPLYTLKDGELELPISLRYNTSGIKTNEEASWVGLGWNLDLGGVVTHFVVGDVDNLDTEYNRIIDLMYVRNSSVTKYSSPSYTPALHNSFKNYAMYSGKYSGKLNPDIFFFSFPGGSGKFFIDHRNDSIYIIDRTEDLKIKIQNNGNDYQARSFIITTTEGVQHTFNYISKHYSVSLYKEVSYSYALTYSKYPNGQIIAYAYSTVPIKQASKYETFQANYGKSGGIYDGGIYAGGATHIYEGTDIYLSSINTANYKIEFNTENRVDITNGKRLKSIRIQAKSDLSNEINYQFDYDYFTSNGSTWRPSEISLEQATKRLKLLGVYQIAGIEKRNYYSFFYDQNTLPDKFTQAIDYWGYYNGKSNSRLLPSIKDIKWGRHIDISGYEKIWTITDENRSYFANRNYDFNYCTAGMLKHIYYPTGGYMNFNYAANEFNEMALNTTTPTRTYYTAQDWNSTSSGYNASVSFTITSKRTATIKFVLNRGLNSWYEIWQAGGGSVNIVAVYQSNVRQIKSYNFQDDCLYHANHYPDKNEIVYEYTMSLDSHMDVGKPFTYFMYADFPNALGNQYGASTKHGSTQVHIDMQSDEPARKIQTVQGCGVRVKSTEFFEKTSDRTPLYKTEYEYSGGVLLDQIQFVKPYSGMYLFETIITPSNTNHTIVAMSTMEISSDNIISNPYSNLSGVGYSTVREMKTSTPGTMIGVTSYCFHNEPVDYALNSMRLDNPINGKLKNKTIFSGGFGTVEKIDYAYDIKPYRRYWGINFIDLLNLFPNLYPGTLPGGSGTTRLMDYPLENDYMAGRIQIIMHDLTAYDIQLIRETITKDYVQNRIHYQYNPKTLQLKSKTVLIDDVDSITHSYTYANDYSFEPYISLANQNRLSEIIEEKVLKKGNLVESFLREYKKYTNANNTLPYRDYRSSITNEIGNPITYSIGSANVNVYPNPHTMYSQYNNAGKSMHIVEDNSLNTIYLWSYNNQYPIVEIKNASYQDVVTALGTYTPESLAQMAIPPVNLINNLRQSTLLRDAIITSYTYHPLFGILSIGHPSGATTYYDYDNFGWLNEVYIMKNGIKEVVETYSYNFKKQ